jgi:predicted PolB exonuclease-like 3'-5' exonuclease
VCRSGMLTFGYDIETTGPNPFENKVITIQYRRDNQNRIFKIWDYDDSERNLITSFLNEWKKIPSRLSSGGDYFVTYNLRLDAPFLLTRCLVNDIDEDLESRVHLWNNLIHGPAFLDLYQLLGGESTRFDQWRIKLGLVPGHFRNYDIPHMYRTRKYSGIEEYVNDELITLEKMYYAVTHEPFFAELQKLRRKLEPEITA